MIPRFIKSIFGTLASWFRRKAREPKGKLLKGSHSAFGRSFALIQLTAGRRPYLLYLPKNYSADRNWPLVVMLHGCRQDAETFAAITRVNGIADRDGFLVLYPEQRRLANSLRCWNWFVRSTQTGAGEAAILTDMIRTIAGDYRVDIKRVYIAGLSAGAAMANNLAISHADLFAACALHSGLMFGAATSPNEALKAMRDGARTDPIAAARSAFLLARGKADTVPVLVIQGDEDETVNKINAEQIVTQFSVLNELLVEETFDGADEPWEKTLSNGGSSGYRYDMTEVHRAGRAVVRKVIVHGLGHAWSGGAANYAYSDPKGPDASELMCDFFAEHGLRDAMRVTRRE